MEDDNELISKLIVNVKNPRTISKFKFEKLKQSIEAFTKMLEIRPIAYDENYIIWGGNMRFLALSELVVENKIKAKNTYFKKLEGFTEQEKKEFAIKDNVESGEWNDDILANEWSDEPLKEWGIFTGEWQEPVDVNEMWKDMPEFSGIAEGKAFRSVIVHFENQDNVNQFSELIKETITEKTKYIWFPRKEKQDLKSMKVISL